MEKQVEEYFLSWTEYGEIMDSLIQKVGEFLNGRKPYIYVIPNNGYMVSQPLIKYFDLKYIEISEGWLLRLSKTKEEVLIVDDLIDTGKSVNKILNTFPRVIGIACMYTKVWLPDSLKSETIISCENTDKWIHFPWEPPDEKINRSQEVICYFDGATKNNQDPNNRNASYGYVITIDNEIVSENSFNDLDYTNNEAEYLGIIELFGELKKRNIKKATIKGDSQLVINQLLGKYKCKANNLKPFYNRAKQLMEGKEYKLVWIPREENDSVNKLIGGKA